jgi:hypothetical protein
MAMLSLSPLEESLISELQKCSTDEERALVLQRFLGSARAWAQVAPMLDSNNDVTLAFRADAPRSTCDPSMLATSERRR